MENDGPLPKTMPPWTLLPTWIVMLHICSKMAVQTMPRVPKQRCPIWWMPGLQVRQDHSMPWWTAGAMLRRPCWCALRRMSRRLLVLLVGWTQNVHRFWLLELLRIFSAFEVTFFSWFTLFVYWPANEFFFWFFHGERMGVFKPIHTWRGSTMDDNSCDECKPELQVLWVWGLNFSKKREEPLGWWDDLILADAVTLVHAHIYIYTRGVFTYTYWDWFRQQGGRYEWSCNVYKWSYQRGIGVITPFSGILTLFLTLRMRKTGRELLVPSIHLKTWLFFKFPCRSG